MFHLYSISTIGKPTKTESTVVVAHGWNRGGGGEEGGITGKGCKVSFGVDGNSVRLTGDSCLTVSTLKPIEMCTLKG